MKRLAGLLLLFAFFFGCAGTAHIMNDEEYDQTIELKNRVVALEKKLEDKQLEDDMDAAAHVGASAKLSALTELAAAPAESDELYINDGGSSKKITALNLMKILESTMTAYEIAIANLPTMTHEYGGLEADVSTYSGLVAISGGATSEVDAKSELEAQIADVSDFAEADGDIYTGVHDFGGATSLEVPNGTDPDVDAVGEVSHDSDGATSYGNDSIIRAYESTNTVQWPVGQKIVTIQVPTVITPQDLANAERDFLPFFINSYGMTFYLTKIELYSDTDNTDVTIEKSDVSDVSSPTAIQAVSIATNLTGVYRGQELTPFTSSTLETGYQFSLDFDDADDPGKVWGFIQGYFDANID